MRDWTKRLAEYDRHNGMTRTSSDPRERLYGRCGCGGCAEVRKEWAVMPAPIDRTRRIGSRSMAGINVCDRCPSLVKGVALGAIQLRTSADTNTSEIITKELCPACIGDMLRVLEAQPSARSGQAYSKPYRRPQAQTDDDVSRATPEQLAAALFEKLMQGQRSIEGSTKVEGDK